MERGFVFDRDYLHKVHEESIGDLTILPSVVGEQYFPGNDKYYKQMNISQEELNELRKKYIGQKVYAGGELNGYYGTITDIIPDEDEFEDYLFIVARSDSSQPRFNRFAKCDLKKVIVTTTLVPLD